MGCTFPPNFSFVSAEFAKLFSFLYAAAQIKRCYGIRDFMGKVASERS